MQITRGQRLKLDQLGIGKRFTIVLTTQGIPVDAACFALDGARKLVSESYMQFFNQPVSPCGAVRAESGGRFSFDLARLPSNIDALTITVAVDGTGTLHSLGGCAASILNGEQTTGSFAFGGALFAGERAAMLIEIYRKDGVWRLNAVAQGFDGGLDALVRHFGGEVAAPTPTPSAPSSVEQKRISLEKRIEREAPQLVSLVKQAKVSLEKSGLGEHRAKVCLCLDISGSMHKLYAAGLVQRFAERILALSARLDDDGEVDVFLFGASVHQPEPMTISNCASYISQLVRRYPLEGDTRYGRAMEAICAFYFGGFASKQPAELPVYVMFVTDGSTSDQATTERVLRESSNRPVFWQYMGIGKGCKSKSRRLLSFSDSDFPFLEALDELSGRKLDNANFFSVSSPDEHSDAELFDRLMT